MAVTRFRYAGVVNARARSAGILEVADRTAIAPGPRIFEIAHADRDAGAVGGCVSPIVTDAPDESTELTVTVKPPPVSLKVPPTWRGASQKKMSEVELALDTVSTR